MKTEIVLSKTFFGKDNALKVMLNQNKECYIHWGWNFKLEKKEWKKVKFGCDELGSIIRVLEGKKDKIAFFHNYNGAQTQIWVSRATDSNAVFFKIKEMTKSLGEGEQEVLALIMKHIIVKMSIAPIEGH